MVASLNAEKQMTPLCTLPDINPPPSRYHHPHGLTALHATVLMTEVCFFLHNLLFNMSAQYLQVSRFLTFISPIGQHLYINIYRSPLGHLGQHLWSCSQGHFATQFMGMFLVVNLSPWFSKSMINLAIREDSNAINESNATVSRWPLLSSHDVIYDVIAAHERIRQ